jgi:hypothetical protein
VAQKNIKKNFHCGIFLVTRSTPCASSAPMGWGRIAIPHTNNSSSPQSWFSPVILRHRNVGDAHAAGASAPKSVRNIPVIHSQNYFQNFFKETQSKRL